MHLVAGEALYDVFVNGSTCESAGELTMKAVAGGSPFNVAVGMARLGSQVGFASDLARDVLGDRIVAQLARENISQQFLRRSATTTALAIVATDNAGRPSYSFSGLEQGAYWPTPEAIEQAEDSITGIHVGSIATVLPNSGGPLFDLVRRFSGRALISLDPNVRLSIVPDVNAWRHAIGGLRPFCEVIKVSEEDIEAVYGHGDPDAICRAWLTDKTTLVVLTRGAEGASMFTANRNRIDVPAAKAVVVDTVGAGDSFMAALLSTMGKRGWLSSKIIAKLGAPEIFALGSLAASAAGLTCSRLGPALPTAREIHGFEAAALGADG